MFSCNNSLIWLWNLGFSCGISLIVQIVTGILLSLRYETKEANIVIENIERYSNGWTWRRIHSIGCTIYFISIYMHIWRSIISCNAKYSSWITGVFLYFFSLITALVGYSLSKGNMGQWALTVVASVLINLPKGEEIFKIIIGDFGISDKILPRIYSIHFLLGLLLPIIVIVHINEVHKKEFSSDLLIRNNLYSKEFISSGIIKDLIMLITILTLINQGMNENSLLWNIIEDVNANEWPLKDKTPEPIGPEWYVLHLFSGLKTVKFENLIISIIIILITLNKKTYKKIFKIFIIIICIILAILALNAHISIEESKIISYILLTICFSSFVV